MNQNNDFDVNKRSGSERKQVVWHWGPSLYGTLQAEDSINKEFWNESGNRKMIMLWGKVSIEKHTRKQSLKC